MSLEGLLTLIPEEEKEKIPKLYGDIVVAIENDINTKMCIDILVENKLSFSKATDIRVLTIPSEELKEKIELYKANGYFDIIKCDIEKLRYNANELIDRINACKRAGKGYQEDGILSSFIYKKEEWDNVSKGLDASFEAANLQNVFGDKYALYEQLANDSTKQFGESDFDRYVDLVGKTENVYEALYGYSDLDESVEYYLKNLATSKMINDEEAILIAIIKSKTISLDEVSNVKEVINSVTVNLQESNGVVR